MSTPINVFITERNIDLYLSKLYLTSIAEERAKLIRLIRDQESRMRSSLEHLENGRRRVEKGRERLVTLRA